MRGVGSVAIVASEINRPRCRLADDVGGLFCIPPRAGYLHFGRVPLRRCGDPLQEDPPAGGLAIVIYGMRELEDGLSSGVQRRRLTHWVSLGVAFLAATAACGQPLNVDVNPLVDAVAKAVSTDETLAGAWLHVDAEDNGAGGRRAVFRRILDADQAAAQMARLDRLIGSLGLPAGGWRIDEARDAQVPYSRLALELDSLIAKDPRFQGCRFLGGFYTENDADGSLGWAPRFEVVREKADKAEGRTDLRNPDLQFDALAKEVRTLFAAQPAWMQAGLSVIDNNLDNRQLVVVDRPAAPELNQLVRDLTAAIHADPALEGMWLNVERDDQGAPNVAPMVYVFQRVLDEDRVGPQSQAIQSLIGRFVPAGRFRVDASRDVLLPYSRMTAALRDLIRRAPKFEGCEFRGGFYAESPIDDSLGWAPRFVVVEEFDPTDKNRKGLRNPERQFEGLVAECRKLLAAEPRWKEEGISVIDNLPKECRQQQVRREPAGPTKNDLIGRIAEAIKNQAELRGSWLEVQLDDQGAPEVAPTIYVFNRGFDASRVGPQAAALDSLMARLVPSGRQRIDSAKDVTLPLTELIQDVNRQADLDPAYAGCLVSEAFYVRGLDGRSWQLVPEGRLWRGNQAQPLHDLVRDTMAAKTAWVGNGVGMAAKASGELELVAPNPGYAAHHFSEAMKRFWSGDYRGASDMLRLASLDWPDNIVYRYWRVLAELAGGDQSAGETRLASTIAGFGLQRHSQAHREVLRSIYRIQGPLRFALMRAEDKAMIGLTTGGGAVPPWGLN